MNIESAQCECQHSHSKCSHAAATYIYGIHNLNKTADIEYQYSEESEGTISSASEMFPIPEEKRNYKALSRETTKDDRASLYNDLRKHGEYTGLYWLLSREFEPDV